MIGPYWAYAYPACVASDRGLGSCVLRSTSLYFLMPMCRTGDISAWTALHNPRGAWSPTGLVTSQDAW